MTSMMEGPLEVEYKPSQVGKEQLIINGCEYMVNRRSGNVIYWRCTFPLCHSSAVLKDGQIMSVRGTHTCLQYLQKKTEEESYSTNQKQLINNSNEDVSISSISDQDKKSEIKLFPIFCKSGFINLPRPKIVLESQREKEEFIKPAKIPKLECVYQDYKQCNKVKDQFYLNIHSKKTSPLHNQVVKSAEQFEEERRLQEVREAWAKNKLYFIEKITADEQKWKTSNILWNCCYTLDRPGTRGQSMTKPIKGTGMKIEQEEVPIRIINHIEPLDDDVNDENDSSFRDELEDSPFIVEQDKRKYDSNLACHIAQKRKKDITKGLDYSLSENYLQSVKVHYNGIKMFQCNDCNETFSEEDSYLNHLKYHGIEMPFVCNKCPMRFAFKSWLSRHLQSRSCGKSFRCVPCKKKFRNSKYLQLHNRKFHQAASGMLFCTTFTEGLRKRKASLKSDDITPQSDRLDSNQSKEYTSQKSLSFTLEELKYAEFLQPKVVLSKDLNNFLKRRPLPLPEPERIFPDHNYAILLTD